VSFDAQQMFYAAQAALATKDAEIEELKRKFFPYGEAKQICGTSWDGKYLIGDKESIRYFHEMQNRGEQIDVYRRAYEQNILAKDAEITRLTQENERMRRENADLLGSLGDLYNLISDSNAPTFIADADYGKITNAAVLISLATPIPDPAGGMPVETIRYETRRNEEPDGGMPVEVECVRCSEPTVESDFNGYCPVCHDDMGVGDA
jgi:hypothetical protein